MPRRADTALKDHFGETAIDIGRQWAARCRDKRSSEFSISREAQYQAIVDLLAGVANVHNAARGMLRAGELARKLGGRAAARRLEHRKNATRVEIAEEKLGRIRESRAKADVYFS